MCHLHLGPNENLKVWTLLSLWPRTLLLGWIIRYFSEFLELKQILEKAFIVHIDSLQKIHSNTNTCVAMDGLKVCGFITQNILCKGIFFWLMPKKKITTKNVTQIMMTTLTIPHRSLRHTRKLNLSEGEPESEELLSGVIRITTMSSNSYFTAPCFKWLKIYHIFSIWGKPLQLE